MTVGLMWMVVEPEFLLHVILLTVGLIINQGDRYAEVAGELLAILIDVINTGAMNDDVRWLQATVPRPRFT